MGKVKMKKYNYSNMLTRFATLDAGIVERGSWVEAFGGLTLGASLRPINMRPVLSGISCDAHAIASDMHRVLVVIGEKDDLDDWRHTGRRRGKSASQLVSAR